MSLSSPNWQLQAIKKLPNSDNITAFGTTYDDNANPEYVVGQSNGRIYALADSQPNWQLTQAQDKSTIVKFSTVNGIELCFTANGTYGAPDAGDNEINALIDMAYGNNTYVAVGVGVGDSIIRSTNGSVWQPVFSSGIDNDLGGLDLSGVTFAFGKFYAIGTHFSLSRQTYTGVLLSSIDGSQWTTLHTWPNTQTNEIYLHNNKVYITASNSQIFSSNDGNKWATTTIGSDVCVYGNGLLADLAFASDNKTEVVNCAGNGISFTSNDSGNTWHKIQDSAHDAIAWDDHLGQFIASGNVGTIYTSSPADVKNSWAQINSNLPSTMDGLYIKVINSKLYLNLTGLSNGNLDFGTYTSTDAQHWTSANISNNYSQLNQFSF